MQTAVRAFRSETGIVSIDPEAQVFPWARVTADPTYITQFVEVLVGWGQWRSLYRVSDGMTTRLYAVSSEA